MIKIFISGEYGFVGLTNKYILEEEFRTLKLEIGNYLSNVWNNKDYGSVVQDFGSIMMNDDSTFFSDMGWKEVKKFNKKKGEAEFRLKIDHDLYVYTDSEGRRKLIVKNIVDSLRELQVLTEGLDFKGDDLISNFLTEVGYSESEINNVRKV